MKYDTESLKSKTILYLYVKESQLLKAIGKRPESHIGYNLLTQITNSECIFLLQQIVSCVIPLFFRYCRP